MEISFWKIEKKSDFEVNWNYLALQCQLLLSQQLSPIIYSILVSLCENKKQKIIFVKITVSISANRNMKKNKIFH